MLNKRSLISIDILRAMAALGVFFYHQHVFFFIARYTGIGIIGYIDNFGAAYAVPLFFLLSGYCIHLSNLKYIKQNLTLSLTKYYKRRFLRIYPAYVSALLISIGVDYLTRNNNISFDDILIHLFSLQGFTSKYFNTINLVMWTISIEIAFYVIYPIFYFIRLKYSLNKALLFSLLVSLISIAWLSPYSSISLPMRFCVSNLWFSWCCGAYLADISTFKSTKFKNRMHIVGGLVTITALIGIYLVPDYLPIVGDQLKILIWIAPLLFIISKEGWLIKNNNFILKLLSKVGLSSYSLYLLHEPLIALKNFIAHQYFPKGLQFTGVAAGVFVIPVIAWYSFKYIEKPFLLRKQASLPTDELVKKADIDYSKYG